MDILKSAPAVASDLPKQDTPPRAEGAAPGERSRAQERFDQLTREKYDAIRTLEAARGENAQLTARLEQLEAKISGLSTPKTGDISELSEPQIMALVQEQALSNPGIVGLAAKELAKREAQTQVKAARTEFNDRQNKVIAVQQTWQRVLSEFGPDATKADSPLRQKAEEVAAQLSNEHGRDVLEKNPLLLYFVFADAQRRLGASQVQTAQTEIDRLRAAEKSRVIGEGAVLRAAETHQSIKAHLAKGDVRSAIRNLDMVRAAGGEAPKSLDGTGQ